MSSYASPFRLHPPFACRGGAPTPPEGTHRSLPYVVPLGRLRQGELVFADAVGAAKLLLGTIHRDDLISPVGAWIANVVHG